MPAESDARPFSCRAGDVGAAVAILLYRAGYGVALHDDIAPTTSQHGMAFTDAVFDWRQAQQRRSQSGSIDLRTGQCLAGARDCAGAILPIADVLRIRTLLGALDARMRKRAVPENQRGLAPLVDWPRPKFRRWQECRSRD